MGTASVGAGLPAMRARVCVGAIARQARSYRGMWGQLLWELAYQRCGPGFVSEPSLASSLLQGYVGTASVGAGLPAMRARICIGAIARQARSCRVMWGQLLWELACQRCGLQVCVGAIAWQARSCRVTWGQLLWELACQRCGPGFVSEPYRDMGGRVVLCMER